MNSDSIGKGNTKPRHSLKHHIITVRGTKIPEPGTHDATHQRPRSAHSLLRSELLELMAPAAQKG